MPRKPFDVKYGRLWVEQPVCDSEEHASETNKKTRRLRSDAGQYVRRRRRSANVFSPFGYFSIDKIIIFVRVMAYDCFSLISFTLAFCCQFIKGTHSQRQTLSLGFIIKICKFRFTFCCARRPSTTELTSLQRTAHFISFRFLAKHRLGCPINHPSL